MKKCYRYLINKNTTKIVLEVDVDNENAITFYKKQEFEIIKKTSYDVPGYYDYWMEKKLLRSLDIYSILRNNSEEKGKSCLQREF